MTEFNPEDLPQRAASGRRSRSIELAADPGMDEPNESTEQDFIGLVEGDQILAKVTIAHPTAVGDGWFTFGTSTRILSGETEEDGFDRLASIVNTRVLDLAEDAIERIEAKVEEQRNNRGRIRPRSN